MILPIRFYHVLATAIVAPMMYWLAYSYYMFILTVTSKKKWLANDSALAKLYVTRKAIAPPRLQRRKEDLRQAERAAIVEVWASVMLSGTKRYW